MKNFFTLWTGQALSLLGSQAVQFALIWWLTARTGSATVLATATLVALMPQVVLGPLIGTLVDRWNRKRVMFIADAGVALASVVLAWLFATGDAGIVHVYAILFVRALGGAFHGPAMIASTTLMVPKEHLTRIQGLNQGLQGGSAIVTAPLGALLIALLPMPGVMLVDVVTALFALIPLVLIRVPQPAVTESGGEGSRVWGEMITGFRYVAKRRGTLGLIGMASLINLCLVPAFALLPLLVLEQLGGDAFQLGWLTSGFGIGTLVGGILLAVWGGFRRKIVTALIGILGLGVATLALGYTPSGGFLQALVAVLFVGAAAAFVNGPIQAVLQATIAPDFQGRVFMLLGSLSTAMTPVGLLMAAPIAEMAGLRVWYTVGGVTCLAAGFVGLLVPTIVDIEESRALGTIAES